MATRGASPQPTIGTDQIANAAQGICTIVVVLLFHVLVVRHNSNRLGQLAFVFPVLLVGSCFLWLRNVSSVVTEPYLDEIFHIPQAQKYCKGRFAEWDDKITTPPGLYLVSVLIPQAAKYVGLIEAYDCPPVSLRAVNVVGLVVLSYLALLCRREIEAPPHGTQPSSKSKPFSVYALHTSFNIALFPLLFFFSGLYYTDIISTVTVIGAFLNHLHRVNQDHSSILSGFWTIALGIISLFMRQTNVFWVVIFMGGLEVVHAVKTLRPARVDRPEMTTLWQHVRYFTRRYSIGDIHDVPLSIAFPEDALFTAISVGVAALCNPGRVLKQIWPYISVLISFSAFVVWNGGVVLGDKSNHVATVHFAQMLYIWPFFAFFSLPLLLPCVLQVLNLAWYLLQRVQGTAPAAATSKQSAMKSSEKTTRSTKHSTSNDRNSNLSSSVPETRESLLLWLARLTFARKLLWPLYLASTIAASGAVVKFNTIIHPFTLADNRHYMFYIFRYTIRRGTLVRLLLILPYTVSRWVVWETLSGFDSWWVMEPYTGPYQSFPFLRPDKLQSGPSQGGLTEASPYSRNKAGKLGLHPTQDSLDYSKNQVATSTGLIFLLTTSLSLITAPLVEPRYFIIPWVMWRLLVPAWNIESQLPKSLLQKTPHPTWLNQVAKSLSQYDARLLLESFWFVAINVVTGYIFLYKPYVWRNEDGGILDDGRLQRFMW